MMNIMTREQMVDEVQKIYNEIERRKILLEARELKGWCENCRRNSVHCGKTNEGRTKCPIEEHYALPKDGFCYLYEAIDYAERSE